jgi:hypothetical protein
LVAISPVGTYTAAQYPSGSILFSPKGVYNYAENSVPYIDDATYPFDNAEDTDDDFATYNNGTGFDAATDKGDICRYITSRSTWVSGSWRLPKASEFQALIAEQTPVFQGPWTSVTTSNGNGTSQIGSSVQLGIGGALTFPASGQRFPGKTGVGVVGLEGFVCTGSSYGINTLCRQLYILPPNVAVAATLRSREVGIPVRCIRVS